MIKYLHKAEVFYSQCSSYEEHFTLYLISFDFETISLFFPHTRSQARLVELSPNILGFAKHQQFPGENLPWEII
jgi:hypothetical protein